MIKPETELRSQEAISREACISPFVAFWSWITIPKCDFKRGMDFAVCGFLTLNYDPKRRISREAWISPFVAFLSWIMIPKKAISSEAWISSFVAFWS
jgi:hypothetical protein